MERFEANIASIQKECIGIFSLGKIQRKVQLLVPLNLKVVHLNDIFDAIGVIADPLRVATFTSFREKTVIFITELCI